MFVFLGSKDVLMSEAAAVDVIAVTSSVPAVHSVPPVFPGSENQVDHSLALLTASTNFFGPPTSNASDKLENDEIGAEIPLFNLIPPSPEKANEVAAPENANEVAAPTPIPLRRSTRSKSKSPAPPLESTSTKVDPVLRRSSRSRSRTPLPGKA